MKISNRLQAVAAMVTVGNRLADIGTDHGYIPIYLVEQGRIPSALAMDVNEGPLQRAQEHIEQYHMEDYIETRRSDGVNMLQEDEADSVIIAGMGGGLVVKILKEGQDVLQGVQEIIVQPQSEIERVRAYVRTHGYLIVDENMIYEDGKYYPICRVVHTDGDLKSSDGVSADVRQGHVENIDQIIEHASDAKQQESNEEETNRILHLQDCFGPILLEQKNQVLIQFLQQKKQQYEQIMQQIGAGQPRYQELAQEVHDISQAFEYMKI